MPKATTIDQLQMLAQRTKTEIDAVDTKVSTLSNSVDELVAAGGEANTIEVVKVNGTALPVTEKAVDVTVPTKVSELTNDSNFQSGSEVSAAIQSAITAAGNATFQVVESIPTPETASSNVLYLVMNSATGHYDIYALVNDEVVLLDDTTVDLTNYVTSESLAASIAGLIKLTDISVTTTGNGNAITSISYDSATGVFTATLGTTFITEDDMATDAEVSQMLTEVFGE